MAYYRCVAIYHPLNYTTIMRDELCITLVARSSFCSYTHALLHTFLMEQLSFCAGAVIPHFFCDLATVLQSSCSDISCNKLLILTERGLIFILPLSGVLGPYIYMAGIILKNDLRKSPEPCLYVTSTSLWCFCTMGQLLVSTFSLHQAT